MIVHAPSSQTTSARRNQHSRLVSRMTGVAATALLATTTCLATGGSDSLKTINNPGGGQVLYGPLEKEMPMRNALGEVLHDAHMRFGEKPVIGKFFHARDSDSVATFFNVTARSQGNKRIAGLAIVSIRTGIVPAVAILYDDEARFGKTEPALMKKLSEAWQKETQKPVVSSTNGSGGATGIFGTTSHAGAVPALHTVVLPDNTASIGLPQGWQVTGGGGGAVTVGGPNGEVINLGNLVQNIYDPRNPKTQGMVSYLSKGSTPFYVCQFPGDVLAAYQCVVAQTRQRNHKPPVTLKILDRADLGANQAETQAVQILAEVDLHDGKGIQMLSGRIGIRRPLGTGSWAMNLSVSTAPKELADKEWPTFAAIFASHRQNGQAIDAENIAVAGRIQAQGRANDILVKARSDANDAHNRQVEQTWDDQAKRNKAFENYQMDRTTVEYRGAEVPAHGTFDNPTADWLVRNDPDHFQYVPTQDLLKGIDY